jgi:hypothetical protein
MFKFILYVSVSSNIFGDVLDLRSKGSLFWQACSRPTIIRRPDDRRNTGACNG